MCSSLAMQILHSSRESSQMQLQLSICITSKAGARLKRNNTAQAKFMQGAYELHLSVANAVHDQLMPSAMQQAHTSHAKCSSCLP